MRFALGLFLSAALFGQQYDLLLQGGTVIDARNKISGRRDVAIADGKVAAVEPNIPASKAKKTVDVGGLYVTPGLIDIHVHVFAGEGPEYMGTSSVFPDDHSFRSGVTTMVDAGSSGWKSFPDFKRRTIDRSRTRVLSLLNIIGTGMGGNNSTEQNTADMDPESTAKRVKEFPANIVGIKTAHYTAPNWIAVEKALEAANLANVPLMVDFGQFSKERPFEELVTKRLRPGDIYTHTYLPSVPMLENGKVRPYLFEARKRGVLFDVGHGSGSFWFRIAVPAIEQGFLPDTISTDIHTSSIMLPRANMITTMSKLLNAGMTLEQVIERSTVNAARAIRRPELGKLTEGAEADIALIEVRRGKFGYVDSGHGKLIGARKLRCVMTIRAGQIVWDSEGLAAAEWKAAGAYSNFK